MGVEKQFLPAGQELGTGEAALALLGIRHGYNLPLASPCRNAVQGFVAVHWPGRKDDRVLRVPTSPHPPSPRIAERDLRSSVEGKSLEFAIGKKPQRLAVGREKGKPGRTLGARDWFGLGFIQGTQVELGRAAVLAQINDAPSIW